MLALLFVSCSDELSVNETGTNTSKGEMVLFRSGTTANNLSTRAKEKATYMPKDDRFVCRMYYKTQEGMEDFDVSNPTDAWLKVNNDVGNSVYWNNQYNDVAENQLDIHGNDNDAPMFYWRNRRPHAFLAWTDYNKMGEKDFKYSSDLYSGMLKFSPYDEIISTNEMKDVWMDTGYEIYGLPEEEKSFDSWSDLKDYVEEHGATADFKDAQAKFDTEDFTDAKYYYEYGWSCKYYLPKDASEEIIDATHKTSSWIKYLMYYDKFEYIRTNSEIEERDPKTGVLLFLKDAKGHYLAAVEYDADDENHENPHYYQTDINGNIRYNEEKPRYTFYMKRTSELNKNVPTQNSYRTNVFDLTKGERTKMTEQPDILQALTIQAPTFATLQQNRVDLYFKHQFSQIQVNIKNANDHSVSLVPNQIEKVELLGVTEQGYVFTELQSNGTVRASSYKEVMATDYTDEQLQNNPYGTSFDMFDRVLTDDEKEMTGTIKSYEAIAFGMLQAIRITWHETEDEGSTRHVTTYRVPEKNEQNQPLRTLQSGVKYIWNMELRRGTLAVVRTEIIPWELNTEDYSTDGFIYKPQPQE